MPKMSLFCKKMNKLHKFSKRYERIRSKTPIDFRWLKTFPSTFTPTYCYKFINILT